VQELGKGSGDLSNRESPEMSSELLLPFVAGTGFEPVTSRYELVASGSSEIAAQRMCWFA
jgi:hypothetical protein